MIMKLKRGEIVLADLDPTVGAEIQKTRPCVIVSPDEMNDTIRTVIILPLTTKSRVLPTRILIKATPTSGLDNDSYAVGDQIKTIDKTRILSKLGRVSLDEEKDLTDVLCAMFGY